MNKQFYTTKEVGMLLGLSPRSITKYVELGQIKAEKMGRDYLIAAEEEYASQGRTSVKGHL